MFDASTLEVFIASTNDLTEERGAVEEVLRDWNSRNGKTRQIMLKPIRWEEDATPEQGPGSFQAVINARLLDHADILIGIVGKRLGSPTENAISGTVEEIERFAAAKKPVLLYFSDRQFNLSEIDAEELDRVREFRSSMQHTGLYRTFKDIADFKAQLRNHLDTLLQDFNALLIPAGRALAFGYFTNFVSPLFETLFDGKEDGTLMLPDSKFSFHLSSFRIRIGKPARSEYANDTTVRELKGSLLKEIDIKGKRRAFRVYVPRIVKETLDDAMRKSLEQKNQGTSRETHFECFDVVDFPTPMFAVYKFVSELEKEILKGSPNESSAMGYWQRQKTIQYNEFFGSLDKYIKGSGKEQYIEYFYFTNDKHFKLPE
jgi:nucleoside 2-deoxyribosyltransferase